MRPKVLDDFTGDYKPSGEQRNYRRCPVCCGTGWKTYVNPVNGKWICFAGGCKAAGRVRAGDAATSLRDRLFKRERGAREFLPIDLPETMPLNETWSKLVADKYNLTHPERYLLRTGMGELSGRVVIPYADRRGDFVFWNARCLTGIVQPKYLAMSGPKPLYVPEYVYRKHSCATMFIVEGPFDAMSLHDRTGYNAVALGGTSLSESQVPELRRLAETGEARRSIRIVLDSAALGAAIALKHKLSGLLPQHDVQVRLLPAGVKDPAAATVEQLRGVLA